MVSPESENGPPAAVVRSLSPSPRLCVRSIVREPPRDGAWSHGGAGHRHTLRIRNGERAGNGRWRVRPVHAMGDRGAQDLVVRRGGNFRVKLENGPGTGQKAVHLDPQIRCLRVYRSGQSGRADQGLKLSEKVEVRRGWFLPGVVALVSPVLFSLPGLPGDGQPQTAVLATHTSPTCFLRRRGRSRIRGDVMHVPSAAVGPAVGCHARSVASCDGSRELMRGVNPGQGGAPGQWWSGRAWDRNLLLPPRLRTLLAPRSPTTSGVPAMAPGLGTSCHWIRCGPVSPITDPRGSFTSVRAVDFPTAVRFLEHLSNDHAIAVGMGSVVGAHLDHHGLIFGTSAAPHSAFSRDTEPTPRGLQIPLPESVPASLVRVAADERRNAPSVLLRQMAGQPRGERDRTKGHAKRDHRRADHEADALPKVGPPSRGHSTWDQRLADVIRQLRRLIERVPVTGNARRRAHRDAENHWGRI